MTGGGSVRLETFTGSAGEFHERDLLAELGTRSPEPVGSAPVVLAPVVLVCEPTSSALVLGSRQTVDVVDGRACARAGVDVVRRRSGGGAVLVEPQGMVWFDVVVPADDRRFVTVVHDVTGSMRWLGEAMLAALTSLEVDDTRMHGGGLLSGPWSSLICFAGLGPGEIVQSERKLVGISQRRTRAGARFQCAVHTQWSPDTMVGLLAPPRPAIAELPDVATLSRDVADALPGALVGVLNAL